jgi:hypothetical protein
LAVKLYMALKWAGLFSKMREEVREAGSGFFEK